MSCVAICALVCFVAHKLTVSTDILSESVELNGALLLAEPVLDYEEKFMPVIASLDHILPFL